MATISDLETQLLAVLDFDVPPGSVTNAITARSLIRKLLVARPVSAGHEGSSHSFDHAQLRSMLDDANAFINLNSANGQVRHLGFADDFRG